jgi:hypothetical protein
MERNAKNPAVAFLGNACEADMLCGAVENQVPEWRTTVAVCKNSRKSQTLAEKICGDEYALTFQANTEDFPSRERFARHWPKRRVAG